MKEENKYALHTEHKFHLQREFRVETGMKKEESEKERKKSH